MSKFQPAGAAETLRSAQKDEQYLRYLRNLISQLIQQSFGALHWLKYQERYEAISDFVYFLLTTLSGYQTLGEEYVNVVQVNQTLRKLPSSLQLAIDVLLQAFGSFLFVYFQRKIKNAFENVLHSKNQSSESSTVWKKRLLFSLYTGLQCSTYIHRLHLILFYFTGAYYHFSKRLTCIRYVMLRQWLAESSTIKSFKILGYITSLHLFTSLIFDIRAHLMSIKSGQQSIDYISHSSNTDTGVSSKDQCSLCLGKRQFTAVTPCGHLFCWSCILNWLQKKEECPLCRDAFTSSRVLYLQNYS